MLVSQPSITRMAARMVTRLSAWKPLNVVHQGAYLSNIKMFASSQNVVTVNSPQRCWFGSDSEIHDGVLQLRSQRRKKVSERVWNEYLASGKGIDQVFSAIDLNHNHKVSVEELTVFLETVDHKGVNENEREMLASLGHDHELDKTEFIQWINLATDPSSAANENADEEYHEEKEMADNVQKVRAKRASKFQKKAWEDFLETRSGADRIFRTIDLNRNLKISVAEISLFLDGLGESSGLRPEAIRSLQEKADDHELNVQEFEAWLAEAL